MTIDELMRYVRILANQCWVRYYLHRLRGKMVLEIMIYKSNDVEALDNELRQKGFKLHADEEWFDHRIMSWSIERTDLEAVRAPSTEVAI